MCVDGTGGLRTPVSYKFAFIYYLKNRDNLSVTMHQTLALGACVCVLVTLGRTTANQARPRLRAQLNPWTGFEDE